MGEAFDIDNWNRKEIYNLYKDYDDPFFNISTYIEISSLYKFCKEENHSFNLSLLYLSTETINDLMEFKLRIINGNLVLFDEIHCGSTIFHEDNSFSFAYFRRRKDLNEFEKEGRAVIDAQLKNKVFDPKNDFHDIIHHSVIPWTSFTSIKHARKISMADSIPKIVVGKYFTDDNKLQLPVSVEVHHALMDGYHVGQYFSIIQQKINDLPK